MHAVPNRRALRAPRAPPTHVSSAIVERVSATGAEGPCTARRRRLPSRARAPLRICRQRGYEEELASPPNGAGAAAVRAVSRSSSTSRCGRVRTRRPAAVAVTRPAPASVAEAKRVEADAASPPSVGGAAAQSRSNAGEGDRARRARPSVRALAPAPEGDAQPARGGVRWWGSILFLGRCRIPTEVRLWNS